MEATAQNERMSHPDVGETSQGLSLVALSVVEHGRPMLICRRLRSNSGMICPDSAEQQGNVLRHETSSRTNLPFPLVTPCTSLKLEVLDFSYCAALISSPA